MYGICSTPLYDHEECRKAVEDFTMNATRVMLSLYQNFGELEILLYYSFFLFRFYFLARPYLFDRCL